MTKEEILDKREAGNDAGVYSDPQIHIAMDEYAKQQAIAFARFINSNYEPHGDNYVSKNKSDNEVYFTDELYSKCTENQFIEQQNKP